MPLPHFSNPPNSPTNSEKDIESLTKIYQVSENIYKLAKAGGKKISVEGIYYHAFKLNDNEVMMIEKFGEIDPYLSVKFLKGTFREDKMDDISFFCEEGTIYLEYIINNEMEMWGLNLRKLSILDKYGADELDFRSWKNDRIKLILNKIIEIQRDERIKIILD